jgi:hypothetical protein
MKQVLGKKVIEARTFVKQFLTKAISQKAKLTT